MTLKACDRIEDLRVDWERELEAIFASRPIDRRRTQLDPGASEPRLRLDASMAERIHRVARVAADRLGCTDPYALFLTPAESRLTAQAMLNERPFAIRLVGPVASALDDAALAMLIGHELGHWMSLGPGANPPSVALEAWSRGATHYLACLCVVACELTADRFAMVAGGGDLEAAVRLDVAGATLDSPAALGRRELEYLERLKQRVERNEDGQKQMIEFHGKKGKVAVSRDDQIESDPPELVARPLRGEQVHLYASDNHHSDFFSCAAPAASVPRAASCRSCAAPIRRRPSSARCRESDSAMRCTK